ncbi:hypothetical protein NEAUS07_0138 [Nematocida ausubeli]|nr:hypothetical protein NEAUS07_0138 [Nematocida ausubeli]
MVGEQAGSQSSAAADIVSQIVSIPRQNIYVHKFDFMKILSVLFESVYAPVGTGASSDFYGVRAFEAGLLAMLFFVIILRLFEFHNNKPIVDLELEKFRGEYTTCFIMDERQAELRNKMNKTLFTIIDEKKIRGETSTFDVTDVVDGIGHELSNEASALSMPEYLSKKFSKNSSSFTKTALSFAITIVFFIRATGVCSNAWTAMLSSNSFLAAAILCLQMIIQMFLFIILLILIFDKSGIFVATLTTMLTSMLSYGILAPSNGFQQGFIQLLFAMFSSEMIKNCLFSVLGIILHSLVTILFKLTTSKTADLVFSIQGADFCRLAIATKKIAEYTKEVEKIPGTIPSEIDDTLINDLVGLEVCMAMPGNFLAFLMFVIASYVIIFEVDMSVIYFILTKAPHVGPFAYIRNNIVTRWITITKIIAYIACFVGSVLIFKCNPM